MAGSGKYRVAAPPLPDQVLVGGSWMSKEEYVAMREALWQQSQWEAELAEAERASYEMGIYSLESQYAVV